MGRKRNGKKSSADKGGGGSGSGSGSGSASVDNQSQASDDDSSLFTCESSPVFGRYLKSKGEIPAGTLILAEKCLLGGPMRSSGLVCLGCHNSEMSDKKRRLSCPKCHWPMCKEVCSRSPFHRDECRFFTENKIKMRESNVPLVYGVSMETPYTRGSGRKDWPPDFMGSEECTFDFGSITVLRGLLLKLNDTEAWKSLLMLEHHNGIRRLLPLWKENQENVVEPLNDCLGLASFFDELEIHSVCGILEVNSFELGEDFSYRGIFPTAAMMAHDCIPNATHFEDSITGSIEVRAAVDIPNGVPITVSYAYSLEGTSQRRQMLLETKFFECICDRCSDPTELSTNLSTLICSKCSTGHVLNVKSKDGGKLWQCSSCNYVIPELEVKQLLDKFSVKAEPIRGIKSSENFLLECSKHLHSCHFIPFGIKFNLCQAYGRERIPLHELSQGELERKLALCLQVLQILNIITPGMTITRGLVLYELQATEIILARRIFESRKFSKALLKRKLETTLKTLIESLDILSLAHSSTPEFSMALSARSETLPDLKQWIQALKTK